MNASHAIELIKSLDTLNGTLDNHSVDFVNSSEDFVNSLDKLSGILSRMTYEGLFDYFTRIKKDGMHAIIEYTGVSSDNTGKIKSGHFSGEILDVLYDCVVFRSGESDCCFPYHAINKISSFTPNPNREYKGHQL